jgi:hypothetical protein
VTNKSLGLSAPREVLELVKRLKLRVLLPQDVALDEPGQVCAQVIGNMATGRDTEDVVELFEGALLRLGEAEEDDEEGDDVETGIETECSRGGKG